MDEEVFEQTDVPTVGDQLRAAREEKGLSLEDVAAQTRIPRRHLESLEISDWEKLPAPTYTIGFAKSYASAVGLERADIGEQLRAEMGGQRTLSSQAEVFEPADPARTMPKGLVFGALAAVVVLLLLFTWLSNRSLEQPDEANNVAVAETPPAAPPQAAAPAPTQPAGGPVVLNATAPVWLQVSERGGATLFSGMLQPGQTFAVPPTATAPILKTGKPEALRITVGNQVTPPVGPPATTVSNVSLLPADLMKAGQPNPAAATPSPAVPSRPAAQPRSERARSTAPAPPPATPPVENPAPTTNTGE
jgi:cytoskeletal protein RodZ